MTKRTGSRLVLDALREAGVDTIFGYPGGAIMPFYDEMMDFPIRHVLTRHEQMAVHAADGYARSSGRLGVVVCTSGPGATNLMTGLCTAMMDLSVDAPIESAHRFGPQLRRIIEVLSVTEVTDEAQCANE